MKTDIIIGADLVPTESNVESFMSGDLSSIIDDNISQLLKRADCRTFNLENRRWFSSNEKHTSGRSLGR